MKILRVCLVAHLICLAPLAFANATDDVVVAYSEALQQLTFETLTDSFGEQKPGSAELTAMSFEAFGRRFDINLQENRALLQSLSGSVSASGIGVYRGDIDGAANSWVRITVENNVPAGLLWDGQEMFAIDIVDNATAIYHLGDLLITDGAFACSATGATDNAGSLLKTVLAEASAGQSQLKAPGAVSQIDMAIIGDSIFLADKGGNAETAMLTRMNNVDGIFSTQLGVQLNVNQIDIFSAGNDPFSNETAANDLLGEVADYRFSTPEQNANGLSHLFTGRDLDNQTVGIAYGGGFGGAICSRRYGSGLTQATHSATFDSLIIAHELGHNFGAPHDGTSGSACEAEPQNFLMAPTLNGSDTFSACSVVQMQDDIDNASCVTTLPGADASIVSNGSDSTVLLGDTGTLVFNVNSNGTDSINNVVADISISQNVTLESATTSSGSCNSGAGNVNCSLGTIAAGTGATITITVGTPSVGNADFAATLTADADANANNNQSSVQLTVDPAVDIAVSTATMVSLEPNESTTISLGIANQATISATDVSLVITPDAGITLDAASWSLGTCGIDTGVVTCTASSLSAQSSSQLILDITGITIGVQSYVVAATVNEADRNLTNNNVSGQVNVGSVPVTPVAQSSSGGGAINLLFLTLLSLLTLSGWRRREPMSA